MIIHGKERNMAMTVGASAQLAEICPNKDLTKIKEALEKPYSEALLFVVKFIRIMINAAEDKRFYEQENYTPDYIKDNEILALSIDDLNALKAEAFEKFTADSKTTVETEQEKKTEDEEETVS